MPGSNPPANHLNFMQTKPNQTTPKPKPDAQPVQTTSSTPEPAVLRLLAALETIQEAGRMSDQPRAVYCALIAQDALNAAKGGAQ